MIQRKLIGVQVRVLPGAPFTAYYLKRAQREALRD